MAGMMVDKSEVEENVDEGEREHAEVEEEEEDLRRKEEETQAEMWELQAELEEREREAQQDRIALNQAREALQESEGESQYLRQQLLDSASTHRTLVSKVQQLQGQMAGTSTSTFSTSATSRQSTQIQGSGAGRTNGVVSMRPASAPLTKLTPSGRVVVPPPMLLDSLSSSGPTLPPGRIRPRSAATNLTSRRAQPTPTPGWGGSQRARSLTPSGVETATVIQSPAGSGRGWQGAEPTCGVGAEDLERSQGRQGVVFSSIAPSSRPTSAWARDGGPRHRPTSALPSKRTHSHHSHAPTSAIPNIVVPVGSPPGGDEVQGGPRLSTMSEYDYLPKPTPRSVLKVDCAVQAAPTPWTRFYFREDLSKAGMGAAGALKRGNQMFQHFDVIELPPLEEGDFLSTDKVMLDSVPHWLPESYQNLMYSRHRAGHATPKIAFKESSQDLRNTAQLFTPDKAKELKMLELANFVSRLLPRSNSDFECLRELQSGLLLHVTRESTLGKSELLNQIRAQLRKEFQNQTHHLLQTLSSEADSSPAEERMLKVASREVSKLAGSVHRAWSLLKITPPHDLNAEIDELRARLLEKDVEMEEMKTMLEWEQDQSRKESEEKDKRIRELLEKMENVDTGLRDAVEQLGKDAVRMNAELEASEAAKRKLEVQIEELEAMCLTLKEELEAVRTEAALEKQRAEAETNVRIQELEGRLQTKQDELAEALKRIKKLGIVSSWKGAVAGTQEDAAHDMILVLQDEITQLKQQLVKSRVTCKWQTVHLRSCYLTAQEEFQKYKKQSEEDNRMGAVERARAAERIRKAAEEERQALKEEHARVAALQEEELQRKDNALREMAKQLDALMDRTYKAEEAEREAREAREQAEELARLLADREPKEVMLNPHLNPDFLKDLFGPDGPLKDNMDYGNFVHLCHTYMLYVREVFGIECMVTALGYDASEVLEELPSSSQGGGPRGSSPPRDTSLDLATPPAPGYTDNIFRVVATTPSMSKTAQQHFLDAGNILPQEPNSCHYRVCATGLPEEWEDADNHSRLLCVLLPLPESAATRGTLGSVPAFGTMLFITPQREHMDPISQATQSQNLEDHDPTHLEATHESDFSGQAGLSKAAELLGAYEIAVVHQTRISTAKVDSADEQFRKLKKAKWELEGALTKTTLLTAMHELKRYRRPPDPVIIILLGVLLMVKDEHVQPFMENLDFALGPRGANQLSYIWVVGRAKLITGTRQGSLVSIMRSVEMADPSVGVDELAAMSPELRALDNMVFHWAAVIVEKFDERAVHNASKVLEVLREWMTVVIKIHNLLVKQVDSGNLSPLM